MEAAAVDLTEPQEKWPMRPAPNAESSARFHLNQMGLGLYTVKIVTKSTGRQGRQEDIKTIIRSV